MPEVRFWDVLSEAERSELTKRGRRRSYAEGDQILPTARDDGWTAVIINGKCRVVAHRENGTGAYLAVRQAGDILGEMAAISGGQRSATVVAVSDMAVRVFPRSIFQQLMETHPLLRQHLLLVLIARLRESDRCQADLSVAGSQLRLTRLVLRIADAEGVRTEQGIELRGFTRLDLATWCGSSRESVQRHVKALTDMGILGPVRVRQRLVVVDLEKLRECAAKTG